MLKRSWCEIDLNQLKINYSLCEKNLTSGCSITAVVKADAYGHGAIPVAKALQSVGCGSFAVSNLEEGIDLRENGINGQILILGYTPVTMLKSVKNHGLCQAVFSKEYAIELIKENIPVDLQIVIDTGMNRIGFSWENPNEIAKTVEILGKTCKIKGFYTHLACVDDYDGKDFTSEQIKRFNRLLSGLDCKGLDCRHFSNSAYFLTGKNDFLSSVRLGICLYGLGNNLLQGVKPILKWKSVVVMVKKIKAGEGVGYGLSFVAKKDLVIATVATGYADGFSFALSNVGRVEIKGRLVNVVGRVCMDMLMVDVTDIENLTIGEEVILLGDNYGADAMASDLNTIPYEIICSISKRVPRAYKNLT
ncbi:MAG: alanine racemase [Clostridia bacterium]|nr:alanine racemase [Clostridia bacterium]